MHRKTLVLSLSLALAFATLPGLATLSFAKTSSGDGATARVPLTGHPAAESKPLAFGMAHEGDCPLDSDVDTSAF